MTEKAIPALPAKLWPWHEHVWACQASGETMVAYAKARRLSVQAFYRAKARLLRYGAGQLPPPRSVFHFPRAAARYAPGRPPGIPLPGAGSRASAPRGAATETRPRG